MSCHKRFKYCFNNLENYLFKNVSIDQLTNLQLVTSRLFIFYMFCIKKKFCFISLQKAVKSTVKLQLTSKPNLKRKTSQPQKKFTAT